MNEEVNPPIAPLGDDGGETINYGPPPPKESVVFVGGPEPVPVGRQYPVFVPLLLLLLTLNYSAFRNITAIHKRLDQMNAENAPAIEMLQRASKQDELFSSMRQDVLKLAKNDPVADRITKTYFAPPTAAPPMVSPTPEAPNTPSSPTTPPGTSPSP
jgi:hypothetical protein